MAIEDLDQSLQARINMTFIIMSDYFYAVYLVKSFYKFLTTKDWRFFFPIVAAFSAFMNNINDIIYFLLYEYFEGTNCKTFLNYFVTTATLNWTPISWLQTIRLISFTKVFYKKSVYYMISAINIILSAAYTISYYNNLFNFTDTNIGESTNKFMFCSVKQKESKIPTKISPTQYVMIFDVCDSTFSLGVLVFTAYMALDSIAHLKFHHAKIKRMVDEGLVQLIVLTVSKIVCYSLMFYLQKKGLMIEDIIWDILSVIVIICSYRLVNVRYSRIGCKYLYIYKYLIIIIIYYNYLR